MANPEEASLYIGVDGGGTKTHLAVADVDGTVVDFAETFCTNWESETYSFDHWLSLFKPIAGKKVAVAVFTVSGWDFEIGKQKTRSHIEKALFENHVEVNQAVYRNDVFSLFQSGIKNSGAGIALSSGTGTVGVAVEGDNYFQTTAYGFISGEWGSGMDIVHHALHKVCSSLLGREEPYPLLIEKAFAYFRVNDLGSLVQLLVGPDLNKRNPGYFLAEIYQAYNLGCPGARIVLEKAGVELAKTAWCLLKKMDKKEVPVILGGGVIKNFGIPPLFKEKLFSLTNLNHEFRILKSDPVYGSLRWALELGHKPMDRVTEKIILDVINESG